MHIQKLIQRRLARQSSERQSELGSTFKLSQSLQQAQRAITQILPASLRARVELTLGREHEWLLLARDGVAAGQLRMLLPQIERVLASRQFLSLPQPRQQAGTSYVRIKVRPEYGTPNKNHGPKTRPISAQSGKLIQGVADACEDDDLRKVLEKLAGHADPAS